MNIHVRRGNDANYVNTCESVAKVNRLNGIHCSVDGCLNANEDCVHHHSNGYIDYFDSVSNSIVAHKTKGWQLVLVKIQKCKEKSILVMQEK